MIMSDDEMAILREHIRALLKAIRERQPPLIFKQLEDSTLAKMHALPVRSEMRIGFRDHDPRDTREQLSRI
jgi:hypothetical protein